MVLQYIVVALIGVITLWVVFRHIWNLFFKPSGGGGCGGCKGCSLSQKGSKTKAEK